MHRKPNFYLCEELGFLPRCLPNFAEENMHSQFSFGLDMLALILIPQLNGIAQDIFFPDAYIYSTKIRLRDLYQKQYFACFSQLAKNIAESKLKIFDILSSAPRLILLPHPFLLLQDRINATKPVRPDDIISRVLFIFPKSAPTVRRIIDIETLLPVVARLRGVFDEVNIIVYYKDIGTRDFELLATLFDNTYCAGNRFDPLFYPRLASIYSLHNCIASPTLDISVLYSAMAKRNFCFTPIDVHESRSSAYQDSRLPSLSHLNLFRSIGSELVPYEMSSCSGFNMFFDAPFQRACDAYTIPNYSPPSSFSIFSAVQTTIKVLDKIHRLILLN